MSYALARQVFLVAVALCVAGKALGAHPSLGGGAGKAVGPISTTSAETLDKGLFAVDFQVDFLAIDTFSEKELLDFAAQGEEIHNVDSVTNYAVSLSYGLTTNMSAHFSIPYVSRKNIEESEPPDEIHEHGDSEGIGDSSLHLHHKVFQSATGFALTLIYGLKLPTGDTSVRDNEGERFEAEFQPGSGSWDPHLGTAGTYSYGPFAFHGHLAYTLVTEGTQDTDLGDRFNYNLAAVYRIKPPFRADLVLELNGAWQDKEEAAGETDKNSGGNVILLSPGIRFRFHPRFNAYLSYGVPIFQKLHGEQNEIDYRAVAGFGIVF